MYIIISKCYGYIKMLYYMHLEQFNIAFIFWIDESNLSNISLLFTSATCTRSHSVHDFLFSDIVMYTIPVYWATVCWRCSFDFGGTWFLVFLTILCKVCNIYLHLHYIVIVLLIYNCCLRELVIGFISCKMFLS